LANVKYYYEWDFPGAEQGFKRAIELSPDLGRAHEQYGLLLVSLGRAAEAMAEARRALELEPFSLRTCFNAGAIYLMSGEYDRAREQGRKCIEMDPSFAGGHMLIAGEAGTRRRYEQAASEFQKAVELGFGTEATSELGTTYALMGQRDKAQQVLSDLVKLSTQRYVRQMDIAKLYMGLGEMDRAFEWSERAFQQREGGLVHLKLIWCRWNPALGRDARLADLQRRIGLQQ
jgi:serine/threonine-protein kinase